MNHFHWLSLSAAAVLLLAAFSSGAVPPAPEIGAEIPDFELVDANGESHRLSDYRGKIVVLDFCSQECPYSRGTAPSIAKLADEYTAKGIVFLGVDSHKGTTPVQIASYAAKMKIPYPILKDTWNEYADAVGATRTPEMYVIDAEGKLAYHGAFDDRKAPDLTGETPYLADALDALLAGKPVETPRVSAWGCAIKRATEREKSRAQTGN